MKGLRTAIIGASVAAVGSVGVALVNYVVEHGELPAWSSGAFRWLSSLMLIQAPWAFWEILVILLAPCAALGTLTYVLWQKNSVDVDDYNKQLMVLRDAKAAKIKLEKDISDLKDAHDNLMASVGELKSSNSDLTSKNAELKEEVAEMQAVAAETKKPKINDSCLSVLKAIANLTERNLTAELDSVGAAVKLGKIQTHAALDVLNESGLISMSGSVRGIRYHLTAKGRAYYLEHQDQ